MNLKFLIIGIPFIYHTYRVGETMELPRLVIRNDLSKSYSFSLPKPLDSSTVWAMISPLENKKAPLTNLDLNGFSSSHTFYII